MVAEDVFAALNELDLDKYEESLRDFLTNYNAEKEDQARRGAVTKQSAMMVSAEEHKEVDLAIDDAEEGEMGSLKRIKTD